MCLVIRVIQRCLGRDPFHWVVLQHLLEQIHKSSRFDASPRVQRICQCLGLPFWELRIKVSQTHDSRPDVGRCRPQNPVQPQQLTMQINSQPQASRYVDCPHLMTDIRPSCSLHSCFVLQTCIFAIKFPLRTGCNNPQLSGRASKANGANPLCGGAREAQNQPSALGPKPLRIYATYLKISKSWPISVPPLNNTRPACTRNIMPPDH